MKRQRTDASSGGRPKSRSDVKSRRPSSSKKPAQKKGPSSLSTFDSGRSTVVTDPALSITLTNSARLGFATNQPITTVTGGYAVNNDYATVHCLNQIPLNLQSSHGRQKKSCMMHSVQLRGYIYCPFNYTPSPLVVLLVYDREGTQANGVFSKANLLSLDSINNDIHAEGVDQQIAQNNTNSSDRLRILRRWVIEPPQTPIAVIPSGGGGVLTDGSGIIASVSGGLTHANRAIHFEEYVNFKKPLEAQWASDAVGTWGGVGSNTKGGLFLVGIQDQLNARQPFFMQYSSRIYFSND